MRTGVYLKEVGRIRLGWWVVKKLERISFSKKSLLKVNKKLSLSGTELLTTIVKKKHTQSKIRSDLNSQSLLCAWQPMLHSRYCRLPLQHTFDPKSHIVHHNP